MNKSLCALLAVALIATPALAQVRPSDCAPVFPLMDEVAAAPLQDVTVAQAAPATAARRGFFGLPFLPLLLAAGGIGALASLGGGDNGSNPTVSPA